MDTREQERVGARFIKASEFKAKCLKLMDQVAVGEGDIVITKNGRPVARLGPYMEKPASLFGIDKGRIRLLGDVVEPLDEKWDAEANPERTLMP